MTPEIRDLLRGLRRPRDTDRQALDALGRVCAPTKPTGRRSAVTPTRSARVPGPPAAADPTRTGGR